MASSTACAALLPASCLLLGLTVHGASAEDKVSLPRYDIAAYCSAYDVPGSSRDGCLKGEQAKRTKLSLEWDDYPFQKRHFCVTTVRFLPKAQRSYNALHGCLVEQGIS